MTQQAEFAAFCQVQHPRLVGMLTLYTGDADLAHDLTQDTLARLWRDWRRVRTAASPEAYAYRAGMNVAKNHFRWRTGHRRRHQRVAQMRDDAHHDGDTATALAVREAVAALPRKKRAALVLRYFADLSVAQTAEIMGIPHNTVKTLTRRALSELRHLVDGVEEEAFDAH